MNGANVNPSPSKPFTPIRPDDVSEDVWGDDWQLVCACIHQGFSPLFSAEASVDVRIAGDGFGRIGIASDLLFDWSHVRDSSDGAVAMMAAICRVKLTLGLR
jgi:hypothetical protein